MPVMAREMETGAAGIGVEVGLLNYTVEGTDLEGL